MSSNNTSIGVAIAVCGNICISVAINTQKLAHSKLQPPSKPHPTENTPLLSHSPKPDSSQESSNELSTSNLSYFRSPLWWAGLVLMSAGEFCNFLSYGFAPASVVAPLGTVALISNCGIAPLLLGEKFHKRDLLGVALAILGAITVVLSTPPSTERFDPDQLVEAIFQTTFLVYVSLCFVALSLLGTLSKSEYFQKFIVIDVGICSILGGFTVLSTKALSSLLNQMFLKCFEYPISWFVLFILITTALSQVIYLNRALQQFDSMHVVPVQFVLFTILTIIGSSILYKDFNHVDRAQALNFIFGCAFIFTGVYILTSTNDSDSYSTTTSSSTSTSPEPVESNRDISSPTYHLQCEPITEEEEPTLTPTGISGRRQAHSMYIPQRAPVAVKISPAGPGHHHEIRRRRSQPVLFTTPGYFLIASTNASRNSRNHFGGGGVGGGGDGTVTNQRAETSRSVTTPL